MSNAKRFLSVILAIVMICSTLVIGANAAYVAYKNEAIADQYDHLDKPVLTTEQYASAAMDEVDRMLNKEQIKLTRDELFGIGELDVTSIDAALDSVYALVNGNLFDMAKKTGLLGDLGNLSVEAFKTESAGGVRRGTAGKTDVDIIFAVLQFLHDNTNLLVSFVEGTIDLGTILPSVVDLSEFTDVNRLLKGLLYEFTYDEEIENPSSASIDAMAQVLIDKYVVNGYQDGDEFVEPLVPALAGMTDISTGSMYNFLDSVLKVLYNELVIPLGNSELKTLIQEFSGVVKIYDETTGELIDEDRSNLNSYANFFNLDYIVEPFEFTEGATLMSDLNNLVKSIFDAIVNPAVFVWQAGDTSMIKTNLVNVAKTLLKSTGGDFFSSYVEIATPEEIDAMSDEDVVIYLIRAIANSSAWGMYFPETTTLREFAFDAISQLFATDAPELDFSALDKNSTDSLVIMGIDYAIYATKDIIDLGLEYVYDMDGVDAQIKKAVNYAIDNYGGLLSGFTFDKNASGWTNLNNLIFSIIPANWLPTQTGGDLKTFIYLVANAIADLDLDALFDLFVYRADSELQSSPKQVIINLVVRVVNIIFPGAFNEATSLDELVTNPALAQAVRAIFDTLWNYRAELVAAILPTLCSILDLTNEQEFEFPELTWDPNAATVEGNSISTAGSLDLKLMVRNGSTGINTGYTDASGVFHQDQLYTYDIKSVTTNLSGVSAAYADKIAGGETIEMRFTGPITGSTPFVVTITYDVLTEDGSPLTDAPITETMYSYISNNEASDTSTPLTSTATGGFQITDGPRYFYASSWGDLTDYTVTLENSNEQAYDGILPVSNAFTVTENITNKKLVTEDGTAYVQLVTEPASVLAKMGDSNGIANIKIFEYADAYDELTGEERDAAWDSLLAHTARKNPTTGVLMSNTNLTYTIGLKIGSVTVQNTSARIFLYRDYGLPGLVEDEMGKHRQASAYADAESTVFAGSTVWEAYNTAMEAAAKAVYSTCRNGSFAQLNTGKADLYKPAFENLTAAIEELDAQVLSAGVDSTIALIDSYFPSNPEGIEYDDPNYIYQGVADYVKYTYENFSDEWDTAEDMIWSATVPDEEGNVAVVNELTKAYNEHRLTLYYNRLLTKTPHKTHLANELANPSRLIGDASDYSTESWDNYQRALAFATATNNEANPVQTKINTAYRELLEAEKRLVAPTSGGGDVADEPTFSIVDPTNTTELEVIESADGLILTGVGYDYAPEDYFVCTGCYVEVTTNDDDMFSTGAVVEVKNSTTDEVIASYTIVVFGDITGDAMTDVSEVSQALLLASSSIEADDIITAAADLTLDGFADVSDVSLFLAAASSSAIIDPVAREVVLA